MDGILWGIPYSTQRLSSAVQMTLRAVVILLAVDGFSSRVEIGEVAGLIERLGLRGLGFSIGVAFNLLPFLRLAATSTWHSLWMRGGLRAKRIRGLQLLFMTVITNALRRGEEIAVAAEARAFTPERSRAIHLRAGRWDPLWIALNWISFAGLLFWPGG